MKKSRRRDGSFFLAMLPLYVTTLVFALLPILYVVALSFMKRDATWGVTSEFTLENYIRLWDPIYLEVLLDSLKLAVKTTLLAFAIGYPFAYCMAKLPPRRRGIVMLLVIVPFWTNALVRIYGWMILLRANGVVNTLLLEMGIVDAPLKLLYTDGAILLGMVYSLLPFMILPSYTSIEKLDWSLVEAARDLGAGKVCAFLTVTLRLPLPGILSGCVLVFVPSMGLFFISDLLGGGKKVLMGNLIQNQILTARNWPFGAALSVVMMLMTLLFLFIYRKSTKQSQPEGMA